MTGIKKGIFHVRSWHTLPSTHMSFGRHYVQWSLFNQLVVCIMLSNMLSINFCGQGVKSQYICKILSQYSISRSCEDRCNSWYKIHKVTQQASNM